MSIFWAYNYDFVVFEVNLMNVLLSFWAYNLVSLFISSKELIIVSYPQGFKTQQQHQYYHKRISLDKRKLIRYTVDNYCGQVTFCSYKHINSYINHLHYKLFFLIFPKNYTYINICTVIIFPNYSFNLCLRNMFLWSFKHIVSGLKTNNPTGEA